MAANFLSKHKGTFVYATALALLLFLLKWLEWRFVIVNHALEIYIGGIALIFTGLGIWLAMKLTEPRTIIVEKEVFLPARPDFVLNEAALSQAGLSKRELEVLQLMAQGLSNQEIAASLFLSLNTVKTHAARLFEKLEVSRRTQAVNKAKEMGLIA